MRLRVTVMMTVEFSKPTRSRSQGLRAHLTISCDLFGGWTSEWTAYRNHRRIGRRRDYCTSHDEALTLAYRTCERMSAGGWVTRPIAPALDPEPDLAALRLDGARSAAELEQLMATGALPLRGDLRHMVEAIGLALRHRPVRRKAAAPDQACLDLVGGASLADHVRDRSVELFAGLMAYALDGDSVARDIAQRARRHTADPDAYVRLIPRSQYGYLHCPLDGFFHPDKALVRLAGRLMGREIRTVSDLTGLNAATVLEMIGGDTLGLKAIERALAAQGLALNARTPNWQAHHRRGLTPQGLRDRL